MDIFLPDKIVTLLCIGTTFSVIEMTVVQKIKMLPFINKDYKIILLNLFLSFSLGIPFAMHFFQIQLVDAFWVSLFGFVGSPSIYAALKNQNIINYTPQPSQKITKPSVKQGELKTDIEMPRG